MADDRPPGETSLRAIVRAMSSAEPVNVPRGGCVESVVTVRTHFFRIDLRPCVGRFIDLRRCVGRFVEAAFREERCVFISASKCKCSSGVAVAQRFARRSDGARADDRFIALVINPTCENACGKFPASRLAPTS